MALCSLTTRHIDIPHEAGEWIEVRPISAKKLRAMDKAAKDAAKRADASAPAGEYVDDTEYGYELTTRMLEESVVAWSYDAPVTPDTIADLDMQTTVWLSEQLSSGAAIPLASSPPSTESSPETAPE